MSVARASLTVLVRDSVLVCTQLVTGIVVARSLGPSLLGIWVLLNLVTAYGEALGRTKADIAAVYLIASENQNVPDVIVSLHFIAVASYSLLATVVALNISHIDNFLFPDHAGLYTPHVLALLIPMALNFHYLNFLYIQLALHKFNLYNLLSLANGLSAGLSTIVLVGILDFEIWGLIIGVTVGFIVACSMGIYTQYTQELGGGRFCKETTAMLLRYGSHFYLNGIVSQLQSNGTRFIALNYLISAQLAFLAQAQGLGALMTKLVDPIATVLYPTVSERQEEDAWELSARCFRTAFLILSICCLVMALFSEHVIVLLYGPDFRPTASLLVFLLPGLLLSGAATTLSNFFNGTGRAAWLLRIALAPLCLTMILCWAALPSLGASGVALSISLGLALHGSILITVFSRLGSKSASYLVPTWSDGAFLCGFCREQAQQIWCATMRWCTSYKFRDRK